MSLQLKYTGGIRRKRLLSNFRCVNTCLSLLYDWTRASIFFNVLFEKSHSSSSSLLCWHLSQDHTQEAESWKPIIYEHFLPGTAICFHVSKLVLKTPTTESFSSFVDSNSGQIQEETYSRTGFQKQRKFRVREENCASIIIQRESSHKGELETGQRMRMQDIALTKLTMHSELKFSLLFSKRGNNPIRPMELS